MKKKASGASVRLTREKANPRGAARKKIPAARPVSRPQAAATPKTRVATVQRPKRRVESRAAQGLTPKSRIEAALAQ